MILAIRTWKGRYTIGQYVKTWRKVRMAPPGAMFKDSLSGWWPASREEILRQFRTGVHDRIRLRAGLPVPPEWKPARIIRKRRARGATRECPWRGSPVPFSLGGRARFCDATCRHSFHS